MNDSNQWLIDRLHRRARGVTEEPPLPVLLEAAAIELSNRLAAAPTPEPDALAESIIQQHGEHYAALLQNALEERL